MKQRSPYCMTCGMRTWQFWLGPDAHPKGCPDGAQTPQACQQARERARTLALMRSAGVRLTENGYGFLMMMERAEVPNAT